MPGPLATAGETALATAGEAVLALLVGAVALVFFLSGLAKLRAPKDFRASLMRVPHATPASSLAVAYTLPVVEIVVALGLVLGHGAARWLAIGLLCAFNGVAALVLAKDLELDCGCFGGLYERPFSRRLIGVNCLGAAGLAAAELAGLGSLSFAGLGLSAALVFVALAWPELEGNRVALEDARLLEKS